MTHRGERPSASSRGIRGGDHSRRAAESCARRAARSRAATYIFPIIDALADAGVAGGLALGEARRIAAQVVFGSAAMVLETGEAPASLKALTPLQPLREADAKALFREAVESARTQMDAWQTKLSGVA